MLNVLYLSNILIKKILCITFVMVMSNVSGGLMVGNLLPHARLMTASMIWSIGVIREYPYVRGYPLS